MFVRRFFAHLLPLFCLLSLSSCLIFEESYQFNRNGSGQMQFCIKAGALAEALGNTESQIDQAFSLEKLSFEDLKPGMAEIAGISGVTVSDDVEQESYSISFRFRDLPSLNLALNYLFLKEASPPAVPFFSQKAQTITLERPLSSAMLSTIQDDPSREMTLAAMEEMFYKINMSFKSPVKAVYSGVSATYIGKRGTQIELETNLKTLFEDPQTLNTSVVLK